MIRLLSILEEIESENQKAMVSGVAEIIRGIEDLANRKQMAYDAMAKFENEGVPFNQAEFISMCGIGGIQDPNHRLYTSLPGVNHVAIREADTPTERTRRYNRKNKKKVRAYLKSTQDDRVARNRDRAKAVKKHGKSKLKGKDVHHPNGPHKGNWRVVKGDHGPDKKK